jgi:hypothetical protein
MRASIEDQSKSVCDRIGSRFMFARPRATLPAQAAFVLDYVVPELVGKDVAQHEPSQAVARP